MTIPTTALSPTVLFPTACPPHAIAHSAPVPVIKTGCYSWDFINLPAGSDHDITEAAFFPAPPASPPVIFKGQTTVPYYAACAALLEMAGLRHR